MSEPKANKRHQKKYYSKGKSFAAYRSYTPKEDLIVLAKEQSDTQISTLLGRPIRGIQMRRHRLIYGLVN